MKQMPKHLTIVSDDNYPHSNTRYEGSGYARRPGNAEGTAVVGGPLRSLFSFSLTLPPRSPAFHALSGEPPRAFGFPPAAFGYLHIAMVIRQPPSIAPPV